jgi:hypothetical protein
MRSSGGMALHKKARMMKKLAVPAMPPVSHIALTVAGITLRIACNDSTLLQTLYERYQLFTVSTEESAQFEIVVDLDMTFQPAPTPDGSIVFDPHTQQFATPGAVGTVAIDSGEMHLHLSPRQPVTDVDYGLRVLYALLAVRHGGILFHAAGIVRHGQAFVFFGHSGSGKTTVARFSSDSTILNDDLVLLLPQQAGWTVHATPFWNASQCGPPRPGSAPLAALLRLVQAPGVLIGRMNQAQALAEVISCIPVAMTYPGYSEVLVQRSMQLLTAVPAYRLHFLRDGSFWQAVDLAMSEQC